MHDHRFRPPLRFGRGCGHGRDDLCHLRIPSPQRCERCTPDPSSRQSACEPLIRTPPKTRSAAMHDAHSHLHLFNHAPEWLAQSPTAPQVSLVSALHPSDWERLSTLHSLHPRRIRPAFGIHPWHAQLLPPAWQDLLRSRLQSIPEAAIGECGLDRRNSPASLEEQSRLLDAQLHIAHEFGRGVVLHVVNAWDIAIPMLERVPPHIPLLLHAFAPKGVSGAPWKRWNAWFSFRTQSLVRKNPALTALIQTLPANRLLIESDACPPLPDTCGNLEEAVCQPLQLGVLALAEMLGSSPQEIETSTDHNFALWCSACREP